MTQLPPSMKSNPKKHKKSSVPKVDSTAQLNELNIRARQGFVSIFDIVDRVLNPNLVGPNTLTTVGISTPGKTDGEKIWLSHTTLPPLVGDNKRPSRRALAVWMGVNVHEVGHTLYTPRESSPLKQWLKAYPVYRPTWNMMEDPRQERLTIAEYYPVRAYLIAAVEELIIKPADRRAQLNMVWPLLCGRTWLSERTRRIAAELWHGGSDSADQVARIVADYQALYDPGVTQVETAKRLILEMYSIMPVPPSGGCNVGEEIRDGTDTPAEAGDDVIERAYVPEPEPEGEEDGDEGDDIADQSAKPEPGDKGKDKPKPDAKPEGDEGEGEPSQPSPKGKVDDAAKPQPPSGPPNDQDLIDSVRDDTETGLDEDKAAEDLDRTLKGLGVSIGDGKGDGLTPGRLSVSPRYDAAQAALAKVFGNYVARAMPGWQHRTSVGRLNVERFFNDDDPDFDTLFDRFTEDYVEDVAIEVVILVDHSSSMDNDQTAMACEAAWAIGRAVDQAGGKSMLWAFDDNCQLLRPFGAKPDPGYYEWVRPNGGTDPLNALRDAHERLTRSTTAHRMVIALTDGLWPRGRGSQTRANPAELMVMMAEAGVATVTCVLDPKQAMTEFEGSTWQANTGAEYGTVMTDPMQMVELFGTILKDRLAKVAARWVEDDD